MEDETVEAFAKDMNALLDKYKVRLTYVFDKGRMVFIKPTRYSACYFGLRGPSKNPEHKGEYTITEPMGG